ncbi:aldo/keto reductase, partial [Candidatus Poribacteria bacterium]|nr:aldo/keto reductase [Candidatus Poribacteria bacterium]
GPTFSRIAQGYASSSGWDYDADEMARFIEAGLDVGITTLDTAAIYGGGRAEMLLGDALERHPALRDRVEIVTKCGIGTFGTSFPHYDAGKPSIIASVEESLHRLRTDHVDALLIHRPSPLMDADEIADAFGELRASGKVLHFGVSNFTPSQFELLGSRLAFPLVTNEVQFSPLYLDPYINGTLDQCQRLRVSPMAWSPLARGRLFTSDSEQAVRVRAELAAVGAELGGASTDQVALAWVLRHPSNVVPILGTGKTERVRAAAGADALDLSREQWLRVWVASTGERLP